MGVEKFLGIERGHAARTGRGDRLAVMVILHIAGGEYARNIGLAAVMRDQVAVFVHVQLAAKHLGIRLVADGDKDAFDGQRRNLVGLRIAQSSQFPRRPWSHPKCPRPRRE